MSSNPVFGTLCLLNLLLFFLRQDALEVEEGQVVFAQQLSREFNAKEIHRFCNRFSCISTMTSFNFSH